GKELAAGLRELEPKLMKTYARAAMREGGKLIQQQAKANVHSVKGLTVKSIRVKVKMKRGTVRASIGPSPNAVRGKGAFYMDWEELGHFAGKRPKARIQKGAEARTDYIKASISAGRKFIPGTHFMERAMQSKGGAAADLVAEKLRTAVEQAKLN
ncbi:MAG: hypothetical protein JO353_08330, partial [Phycisphaerae bacterium]|nr:hypothetical protein [Phycisphaerae bacterium]